MATATDQITAYQQLQQEMNTAQQRYQDAIASAAAQYQLDCQVASNRFHESFAKLQAEMQGRVASVVEAVGSALNGLMGVRG